MTIEIIKITGKGPILYWHILYKNVLLATADSLMGDPPEKLIANAPPAMDTAIVEINE
jgi:hypothetical protein